MFYYRYIVSKPVKAINNTNTHTQKEEKFQPRKVNLPKLTNSRGKMFSTTTVITHFIDHNDP